MTGKELLHRGREWTESALVEALHLVASGLPNRRLSDDECRELRSKDEKWRKDVPASGDLDATLRLDRPWAPEAMSARLEWLCNAGITEHQTGRQREADLANRAGIVISVPGMASPSHHCAKPTESFNQLMKESELGRVYLVGCLSGPPSENARLGQWSEMEVHPRDTQPKFATDTIWVDPSLHGGQSPSGQVTPESGVVLTMSSNLLAHMSFQGEHLGASHCPNDFEKWHLALRVALATSAAFRCLEASKWAQSKMQDGSPKLFAKLAELFHSRTVRILRLAIEDSSCG